MNLETFLVSEQRKFRKRKKILSENDKHKFYYQREFVNFCVREGIKDTKDISNKVYANYVRYLKTIKKNNERTVLDKCYIVKNFLEKMDCSVLPNPWRKYNANAR